LLAYLYPARHELLKLGPPAGERPDLSLATLSVLVGVLLARPAWRWYDMQLLRAHDEHSTLQHWTIMAVLAVGLVAAGLLAATKRPGWVTLGVSAGVALVYLGSAAVAAPDHAGSWGTGGGLTAVGAGVAFLIVTAVSARRATACRNALDPA
jgi:hypothetical protein